MSYKITQSYCWYDNRSMIVKMYFIQGVPFTFDELPDSVYEDQDIVKDADKNGSYTPEELFYSSFYLIDEECHPMIFSLDIENPEDMPDEMDMDCFFDEEDLMG